MYPNSYHSELLRLRRKRRRTALGLFPPKPKNPYVPPSRYGATYEAPRGENRGYIFRDQSIITYKVWRVEKTADKLNLISPAKHFEWPCENEIVKHRIFAFETEKAAYNSQYHHKLATSIVTLVGVLEMWGEVDYYAGHTDIISADHNVLKQILWFNKYEKRAAMRVAERYNVSCKQRPVP